MADRNNSYYLFIPTVDITQAMINRSTSISSDDVPHKTIDSVDNCLIEVLKSEIINTTIFDNYEWLEKNAAIVVKEA